MRSGSSVLRLRPCGLYAQCVRTDSAHSRSPAMRPSGAMRSAVGLCACGMRPSLLKLRWPRGASPPLSLPPSPRRVI